MVGKKLVAISETLHRELKIKAAMEGKSLNAVLNDLVKEKENPPFNP